MVYSNKFVLCVLLNGKPQEELANGQVKLPFGSEYALRLRNRNNRRAVVKLYIDGENVSGGGYVIPANDHVDIKRHHDVDRAFKFVALNSEEAIDYGKNGPNDDKVKGTIEARFYLEKEQPQVIYRDVHHHHHHDHYYPKPTPWPIRPYYGYDGGLRTTCGGSSAAPAGTFGMSNSNESDSGVNMTCSAGGTQSSAGPRGMKRSRTKSAEYYSCEVPQPTLSFNAAPAPELKDGCTVEGYSTGQSFTTAWVDTEETYTSLKVFLQGFEEEKPVTVAREEAPRKIRNTRKRKTNKDRRLDDLESENEELRRKLAEIENEELKKKLEKAKK